MTAPLQPASHRCRHGIGCWLYALLGRVDVPLLPANQSLLGEFLRLACKARVLLQESVESVDASPRVALLNVFIVVVAGYFKQASPELLGARR